jgi:hypothetical protein
MEKDGGRISASFAPHYNMVEEKSHEFLYTPEINLHIYK